MSILEVHGLAQGFGGKTLYRDVSFELYKNERIGIVGQNGAGKSTLLHTLLGQAAPDEGWLRWQKGLRIGVLDQHATVQGGEDIATYLRTAFADLYQAEREMLALYVRAGRPGGEAALEQAAALQQRLETEGYYALDAEADKVANGLGLPALGMATPVRDLSGGQRAKVMLAKLLLEKADVLVMDEPTNFLDAAHISWLAGALAAYPGTLLVVSHDTAFLEKVCTGILDIEFGTVRKYHGGYAEFLAQKKHLREEYIRRYNAQQAHIQRTEEYIRRNIAGVHTKNARGRRKQLERLNRLEAPEFVAKPRFRFAAEGLATDKALFLDRLEVGYEYPLLPPITLAVGGAQKVAVTGFNGIGKSTLLKTLVGGLAPKGGSHSFAPGAQVGYFAQDLAWEDPTRTPLQFLQGSFPAQHTRALRRALAECGVKTEHMEQPLETLSGGEQAKVKLCRLVQQGGNLLLLDEPTNHLDAEAKQALREALAHFGGAVLLVCHETAFYKGLVDRVLDIAGLV